ncbi:MAG: Trk system potassium transporter TrkA [Methylocystaceae bacterium]
MIIVVGAGKVGFSIAEILSRENQDVVVIEADEERALNIDNSLDVKVIVGNGASWDTLEKAGVKHASMLVAVTEMDELNMIACILAKRYGAKVTVARVRNPEYTETPHFRPSSLLGIDYIINPERVTAMEIAKLVDAPESLNVEFFANGLVQMLELKVTEDSTLTGKALKDLRKKEQYTIAAVERKGETYIPDGNFVIHTGDHVRVIAETNNMVEVEKEIGIHRRRVQSVTIIGGGRTGYYLAHILERRNIKVKVIEKDEKRAKHISKLLKKALVLHGDASDMDLLRTEYVGVSDLLIAVTNDDRLNLLCSLIGKNLGVKGTVAQVKRSDVVPVLEQVGIDVVLNPRQLCASAILSYLRRSKVVLMGQSRTEIIELEVDPGSKVDGNRLRQCNLPKGVLIGALTRGRKVIIPQGDTMMAKGDKVLIFCLSEQITRVSKLFQKDK